MLRRPPDTRGTQRGAALLIMVVVMVLGMAAVLLGSLSSASISLSRQQLTRTALAQAKEALIARAAVDPSLPGSLPCPDAVTNIAGSNVPDDGIADLLAGNGCPSYIGRLPWKTLGLNDIRDGQGERLWYALSPAFRDDNSNHINSDSTGTLNISGDFTASNVIAIVFSAGPPLTGDSRANTQTAPCPSLAGTALNGMAVPESWCAANYLDGSNALASTAAAPNSNYQAGAPVDPQNNDQLLALTHEQLFPAVEMRIGREVKACLDAYALAKGGRYPWAVPPSNTYYTGETDTKFGRIPYQQTISDSRITDFITALDQLQNRVDACIASDSSANAYALNNAGNYLESSALSLIAAQVTTPAIPAAVTTPGKTAGDRAQYGNMCDTINGNPTSNTVQSNLDAANTALIASLSTWVATSNTSRAVACPTVFANGYWQDWKDMVFYQVDDSYKPTGSATGSGSLTVSNLSNARFRAAVLLGRQVFPPKTLPRNQNMAGDYLEAPNAHSPSNPVTTFQSYRPGETAYKVNSNDLVLCLDGLTNCK